MPSAPALEIRPRTTGEILDDAWRLYRADAPRLLLLHSLFHVPAFSVLLILICSPLPSSMVVRLLMPLLAALLLPATSVGSGAVQERFRRLAENHDATFAECVGGAARRGFEHAAVRALVLVAFVLAIPGLILWPFTATLPTIIADGKGLIHNFGRIGQEATFEPGKVSAVVYCRLPMLAMAWVNAHLLVQVALWSAGNLGGFDVALLEFQLSAANPAYGLALGLIVWLLLAPFFEASNYLLYLDTRTRREGLDLLYRVQRAFSAFDPKRVATVLAVVAGWLLGAAAIQAGPQDVRAEPPFFTKKDDIKKLLRQRSDESPAETKKAQPDKIEPKRVEIRHDGPGDGGVSGGPSVSVPSPALGNVCWLVFAGLVLAVVVAGLVLFWVNRPKSRRESAAKTGRSDVNAEETIEQLHQQPVAELLRRADNLAAQGRHLEALRAAYLAVLSLLHRKQLLRYELTRTNGEYVREVRLAAHAPPALHEPFQQLTSFFETKWYGERACEAREYASARDSVVSIQSIVGAS